MGVPRLTRIALVLLAFLLIAISGFTPVTLLILIVPPIAILLWKGLQKLPKERRYPIIGGILFLLMLVVLPLAAGAVQIGEDMQSQYTVHTRTELKLAGYTVSYVLPGTYGTIVQQMAERTVVTGLVAISRASSFTSRSGFKFELPDLKYDLGFIRGAQAVAKTWDGGGGGDTNWGTATNWDADTLPVALDSVTFDATSNTAVTVNIATPALIGFTMAAAYTNTITVTAAQTVTWGPLTQAGASTLATGAFAVRVDSFNASVAGAIVTTTGAGSWTVLGAWTNSSTSASWSFAAPITFNATGNRTMTFAGANLPGNEFGGAVTFDNIGNGADVNYTMATRGLVWGGALTLQSTPGLGNVVLTTTGLALTGGSIVLGVAGNTNIGLVATTTTASVTNVNIGTVGNGGGSLTTTSGSWTISGVLNINGNNAFSFFTASASTVAVTGAVTVVASAAYITSTAGGSWTASGAWTNSSTSASWSFAAPITFNSTANQTMTFCATCGGSNEFTGAVTFESTAVGVVTFTMATNGLRWSATLTISDAGGAVTTILATAALGLTGGNLTIAAGGQLTATTSTVSVAVVSISGTTSVITSTAGAWTVTGNWTNSSTAAAWSFAASITFTAAAADVTITPCNGCNGGGDEFSSGTVTFNTTAVVNRNFALVTRNLRANAITITDNGVTTSTLTVAALDIVFNALTVDTANGGRLSMDGLTITSRFTLTQTVAASRVTMTTLTSYSFVLGAENVNWNYTVSDAASALTWSVSGFQPLQSYAVTHGGPNIGPLIANAGGIISYTVTGAGADIILPLTSAGSGGGFSRSFDADFLVGVACSVVSFQVVSNDPKGTQVATALWNFGDGQSSKDLNPTHRYILSGRYVVSATLNGPFGEQATPVKNLNVINCGNVMGSMFIITMMVFLALLSIAFLAVKNIKGMVVTWLFGGVMFLFRMPLESFLSLFLQWVNVLPVYVLGLAAMVAVGGTIATTKKGSRWAFFLTYMSMALVASFMVIYFRLPPWVLP